jgi:uncharacterized protein YecE (DUF72 family)
VGTLYAGTSGFSYPAWRGEGRFYPAGLAAGRMLEFYAGRLNGVELNGSFYRTTPAGTLANWVAATPEGFRLCFKGHRGLTYSADAFDKRGLAAELGRRLGAAGTRLGPVLVQFPPTREHDPALLDTVLEALAIPVAAEFRHPSWLSEDVYGVLRRHGAALVVGDDERWPAAPRIATGPLAYYRLRRPAYTAAEVGRWRRELRAEAADRDVHAYVRHEPDAPAIAARLLA